MKDLRQLLENLRRPALLIGAARAGLTDYDRARDLPRIFRTSMPPTPERAVTDLLEEEAELEQRRRSGIATYSLTRHIDVLIAMISEARLLPPIDRQQT